MQLSIEQLFKKINEINGMLKLSKQRDELELEYNTQMRDLKLDAQVFLIIIGFSRPAASLRVRGIQF